ncbi:MAG: DUF7305 domain-containing protein [Dehalobacterium sp.]|jgi:hypothetical protein
MMKYVSNDRGAILVFVAFALITLFVFGTFLLDISKTDFDVSHTQVARVQAYYNAESLVNQAIAQLSVDKEMQGDLKDKIDSLNPEDADYEPELLDISVTEFDTGEEKTVTFTVHKVAEDDVNLSTDVSGSYFGKYGKSTKNIKMQANIAIENNSRWSLPENAAIITEGTYSAKNNNVVSGNLYAAEIVIENNNTINGDVYANSITTGNNSTYHNKNPQAEDVFPNFDAIEFDPPKWTKKTFNSSINLNGLPSGNYIVENEGTYEISGPYSGNIVLIFTENVILGRDNNNVTIKPSNNNYEENSLIIICLKDIEMNFKNNFKFEGIIAALGGSVTFKNNADIIGSILAKTGVIGSKNNFNITFNDKLATHFNNIVNELIVDNDLDPDPSIQNFDLDIVYWK